MTRGQSFYLTASAQPDDFAGGYQIGADPFVHHGGENRCYVVVRAGFADNHAIRLTVDEAQELVDKLQANIDAANEPEPFLAPENTTHLIDRDGDRWDRNGDLWSVSGQGFDSNMFNNQTFDHVVREYGPVTPYASLALPEVGA